MLVEHSLRDLLAALASPDPTPGGGSASAVASAMGASLLLMVAALPKTRSGSEEDRAALAAARTELAGVRQRLIEAIDADTAAYNQVVAAYKLPKTREAEQAVRQASVQRALQAATDVPLGVMRLSAAALRHARTVAAHGHRAATSDVGVAVALLRAGFQGGRLNANINIGSLTDVAYTESVKVAIGRLSDEAMRAADEADAALERFA